MPGECHGNNWDAADKSVRAIRLIGDFIVAGFAASRAIIQPVGAEPDIYLRLAKNAVFLAFAVVFGHFALSAVSFGFGGHERNVPWAWIGGKFPW